MKTHNNSC